MPSFLIFSFAISTNSSCCSKPSTFSQILDLESYRYYIDTPVNDTTYFNLTGMPDRLSYGKHPFSITFNDPEKQPLLKNLSNIVFVINNLF